MEWDFSVSACFASCFSRWGQVLDLEHGVVWGHFQSILRLPELSSGDQGSAPVALP